MRIFKKDTPIEIAIALVFAASAVAYTFGYNLAMHKFNDVVSYNQEKEKMYSKLSEIDHKIRQEYIDEINEKDLVAGLCSGYVLGLNNNICRYFSPDEYKQFISKKSFDDNAVRYEQIDEQIGHIIISSVTSETGNMFMNAVRNLSQEGISKIVLDLRGVSSDDIEPVSKCLDSVVEKGDLISTIDKKGNKEVVYKSTSDGLDLKFSVIVDNNTSGTPELIASALKDSGKGKIVGEKTAGKAVKQEAIALSDGSGIVFPSAHYVTMSNRILTHNGVSPDIEIVLDNDKKTELAQGILSKEDDIQFQEALKSLK